MGDKAVINMSKNGMYSEDNLAIYLNSNGDISSIDGYLLAVREILKHRKGYFDIACASLIYTISLFSHNSLSMGVDYSKNLDENNRQNGVYVIDMMSLEISQRVYKIKDEQRNGNSQEVANSILEKYKILNGE